MKKELAPFCAAIFFLRLELLRGGSAPSLAHLAEEYWPSRPIKGSTKVIEDFDATVKAAEIGLTKRLVSAISAISELPDLLLQTNFERRNISDSLQRRSVSSGAATVAVAAGTGPHGQL